MKFTVSIECDNEKQLAELASQIQGSGKVMSKSLHSGNSFDTPVLKPDPVAEVILLELLAQHADLLYPQAHDLAELVGVSYRTVQRRIRKMQQDAENETTKTGKWRSV